MAQAVKANQNKKAEKLLLEAIKLTPHHAASHYNLACVRAREGNTGQALNDLERAIDLGLDRPELLRQDPDLEPLRGTERFRALLKRVERPAGKAPKSSEQEAKAEREPSEPGQPSKKVRVVPEVLDDTGKAMIGETNTVWDPRLGLFRSFFRLEDPEAIAGPVVGRAGPKEVAANLNLWYAKGQAIGLRHVLYDNRDRGHSTLRRAVAPQLAHLKYPDQATERDLDYGAQTAFLFNLPTLGNSSTALTGGWFWRSQARRALTKPNGGRLLYAQYRSNHLYVYPEHRDHDPKHGDVFVANTPYQLISQGSSGSDRPLMRAVAYILGAYKPKVAKALIRSGLLMPTTQMIFRWHYAEQPAGATYLNGVSHPTAFNGKGIDGDGLDYDGMVRMAQLMPLGHVPPLVQLQVLEESQPQPGVDYFAAPDRTQRFFDTPSAISRVFRSVRDQRMTLRVSAEQTADPNKRDLKFYWVVLRGPAEEVTIERVNDSGSVVDLSVPWIEPRPVRPGSDLTSPRVDVGVVAHNGAYFSAPAFVSVFCLDERRSYDEANRLTQVEYRGGNYIDPAISLRKDWRRDVYHYDESGQLLGWTRHRQDDQKQRFTADGAVVLKTDSSGRPLTARSVRYVAKSSGRGRRARLVQQPGAQVLHYAYAGPIDQRGRVRERRPVDRR
jgi:hypothetical protein